MMTEAIDYEQVLADLKARRVQLDSAIAAIEQMIGGITSAVPGVKAIEPVDIADDAFHGMSIADATKKYLGIVRRKKSTKEIMEALENGGLPSSAYNTVYAVLRRREEQVGDIVKVGSDWGLAEWYPGRARRVKKSGAPLGPPSPASTNEENSK
jgi:hypothetical protein